MSARTTLVSLMVESALCGYDAALSGASRESVARAATGAGEQLADQLLAAKAEEADETAPTT